MQPLALLPSLMHFSQPPLLYQVHSLQLSFNEDSSLLLLGKRPRNLGTNYYARNKVLARNSTSNTQRTTPKVPAPHQGCSTAHRGSEGTNDSSSASSYRRCRCSSRDLRPLPGPFSSIIIIIIIIIKISDASPSGKTRTFTKKPTSTCATAPLKKKNGR